MTIKNYDFLDFGASKGGSIDFAKARLGGKRGLGIDIDPKRVKKMQNAGYEALVGDFRDLKLPAKCVRFVLMSHILEHVPDLDIVERTIYTARKAATDFLVITGPYFDADEYLAGLGFKFHWSDYTGHTCHLTTPQLMKILGKLGLDDYEIYLRGPIADSSHEHILPKTTKRDSHRYDPNKHPKKRKVQFDRPVWTDFVCYVRLREIPKWRELTKGFKNATPYIKHQGRTTYHWEKVESKYRAAKEALQQADKEGHRPSRVMVHQRNKYYEIIKAWQGDSDLIRSQWSHYWRRLTPFIKR